MPATSAISWFTWLAMQMHRHSIYIRMSVTVSTDRKWMWRLAESEQVYEQKQTALHNHDMHSFLDVAKDCRVQTIAVLLAAAQRKAAHGCHEQRPTSCMQVEVATHIKAMLMIARHSGQVVLSDSTWVTGLINQGPALRHELLQLASNVPQTSGNYAATTVDKGSQLFL